MTTMIERGPDPRFPDGRGSGCSLFVYGPEVKRLRAENERLRESVAQLTEQLDKLKLDGVSALAATIDRTRPIALVLSATERMFDVSRPALLSNQRTRWVVLARDAAIWAARTAFGISYPQLGRRLQRDHTTIMTAFRRAEALRRHDAEFRRMTDGLLQMVGGGAQKEATHAG